MMNAPSLLAVIAAVCAPAAAQAAANPAAAERCEAAVSETIVTLRGSAARDIRFVAAKRVLAPPADEEIAVKGEGRYQRGGGAIVPFSYSCAYNTGTGVASGVMFREIGAPTAADTAWQPDLANLSPDACESAAAAVLKGKHPQIGRIVFDGQTRQLKPAPNERVSLEGNGALQRAQGMNAIPFSYRCEFDARSGRLVQAQTSE